MSNRKYRLRPSALAMALASTFSAWSASAEAGNIVLADNSQVLQKWQQTTGAGAAPQLVEKPEGGTTIQWQGGVTLDAYNNSTTGTNLTTPMSGGDKYKIQATGDLRSTDNKAGAVTYLQFSATHTNDTSAISHAPGGQLNSLQFGQAGPGYLFAMGDVSANFSSLGANTGLRGLLAQKQIGQSTVTATAGVVAESWEALANAVDRTTYLRQVMAAKMETPLTDSAKMYVTVQGYEDDAASVANGISALAPASGRSATAGFAYQSGNFGLQGEAAASRWQEEGQDRKHGMAVILDAAWTFDKGGLRAGYHEIGKYYSSLSSQGGNGVKEAYVNGNWMAASWLSLNADVRHSENELAATPPLTVPPTPATVNAAKSNAFALTEVINFGAGHPEWSLVLSQSLSDGENGDGSVNRNQNLGATVSYSQQSWNGSLGFNQAKITNDGASATNGRTDVWSLMVGKLWMGEAWSAGLNFMCNMQDQKLDAGAGPRTISAQLGLTSQRTGWGALTASLLRGKTKQSGTNDLTQKGWQLDASHPFSNNNSIKLYYRDQRVSGSSATPSADYSQKSVGMQLVYTF